MNRRYLTLIPIIAIASLPVFTSLREINPKETQRRDLDLIIPVQTKMRLNNIGTHSIRPMESDSLKEIEKRIKFDFTLTRKQVEEKLLANFKEVPDSLVDMWERSGKLEMRQIDGEKRYFKNAVPNLMRLLAFESMNGKQDPSAFNAKDAVLDSFCLQHTNAVILASGSSSAPVLPQKMTIKYTMTVKPNVVPEGAVLRCWLPAPREGIARQKEFKMICAEPEKYTLAPNDNLQRTFYMERVAVKNQPTIFSVEYAIQTAAQYFDLAPEDVLPYDTTSAIYVHYTKERPPHLVFTPGIEALGTRIVGAETNPLKKVEKIYQWINDSIPWASALEYCTMPCIPQYVLENRHGDCGMQTFLFMSLARSQGIPVKWQSGFMLHPGKVNLHDWCEVYYEGIGWVPLDQSFKLQKTTDPKLRAFYVHGIDAYRLIVNDDYAQALFPPKRYLRSEPYDFQRGELEWDGGNLYFNDWSWDIDVDYQ